MLASGEDRIGAGRRVGPLDQALGALLLLVMVLGGLALWIGVPVAVLWALGKATDSPTEHLILGLLAVPLGMAFWGLVLALLNAVYLRVSGFAPRSNGGEWSPRLRGPLDRILVASALVALVALLGWLIFGDTRTGSGPW
jgi:hypothetical protein